MTNADILQLAIDKAEKNGYNALLPHTVIQDPQMMPFVVIIDSAFTFSFYDIVFSHDFAKAFFGEEMTMCVINTYSYALPQWMASLQHMVLLPDEEKLDYLKGSL